MIISLTDRRDSIAAFIPKFSQLPLSYTDSTTFPESTTSIVVPVADPRQDLRDYDFGFLFDYQIFPSNILVYRGEWQEKHRTMQVGDIIVQQTFLPPAPVSIKAIFGVRVLEMIHTPTRIGFCYGTLQGHAESGLSWFYFEKKEGELRAVIRTWSQPGLWVSKVMGPVFTRPYQGWCTRRALGKMGEEFRGRNA